MNTSGLIYALCDPATGEVRYVGKTVRTPQRRLYYHVKKASTGSQLYVCNWIRSLDGSPVIKVLEENPPNLNESEIRWIAKLRREGARLTNLTDGGDGGDTSMFWTDEGRVKMRAATSRRWKDPQQRATQAETARRTHTGMKRTDETRKKQSEAAKRRWAKE